MSLDDVMDAVFGQQVRGGGEEGGREEKRGKGEGSLQQQEQLSAPLPNNGARQRLLFS